MENTLYQFKNISDVDLSKLNKDMYVCLLYYNKNGTKKSFKKDLYFNNGSFFEVPEEYIITHILIEKEVTIAPSDEEINKLSSDFNKPFFNSYGIFGQECFLQGFKSSLKFLQTNKRSMNKTEFKKKLKQLKTPSVVNTNEESKIDEIVKVFNVLKLKANLKDSIYLDGVLSVIESVRNSPKYSTHNEAIKLKPLSEISDDDLSDLFGILKPTFFINAPTYCIDYWINGGDIGSIRLNDFRAYQYLQSKNYQLPKYF